MKMQLNDVVGKKVASIIMLNDESQIIIEFEDKTLLNLQSSAYNEKNDCWIMGEGQSEIDWDIDRVVSDADAENVYLESELEKERESKEEGYETSTI